jgi:hypothetical protein
MSCLTLAKECRKASKLTYWLWKIFIDISVMQVHGQSRSKTQFSIQDICTPEDFDGFSAALLVYEGAKEHILAI